MKIFTQPLLRRRFKAGFSLAEVSIATGVAALALTTLLGLIPHGITDIKMAGDIAAETRIADHILGTLTQARWQDASGRDLLSTKFDQHRYYFDEQGVELEEDQAQGTDLAYVAQVRVPPQNVNLPGPAEAGSQPALVDPYLRKVTVKFTSVPRADFDFDHALPIAFRSQTTLIARTAN